MEARDDHPEGADESVLCVGCRQEGRRADLERFVYHPSVGLTYDMRGGAPGDQAFVHPLVGCLEAAAWAGLRRAFGEALPDLEAASLVDDLHTGIRRRLIERLRNAGRQGSIAAGVDEVRRRLRDGDPELVAVAADADEVASRAEAQGAPLYELLSREAFGEPFSAESVGAIAVLPGDRAAAIGRDCEKLVCLQEFEG